MGKGIKHDMQVVVFEAQEMGDISVHEGQIMRASVGGDVHTPQKGRQGGWSGNAELSQKLPHTA